MIHKIVKTRFMVRKIRVHESSDLNTDETELELECGKKNDMDPAP